LELSNLQHMWLGLWVDNDPNNFIKELNALELILQDSTTDFSHLLGISVGSEAIYRKDVTINEAITNLESTKSLLSEYNINVPTTIVEIAPIYSNSQQLRLAVDTIMTNTFPFWEAIPIDNAVDNLDENLSWLLSLPESQGKEFVLGEHGWPSNGYIDGVGVASGDNQQQYMADSYCYLKSNGYPYYIFTGIDNDWRQEQDPNNTIEGNWGFLEADLTLKSNFVDFTFDCGDGIIHSFGAVDWSVPELAAVEIDTENASCGLWLGCEALSGNCCPTPNGDYLGCCRTENFIGTTADGSSGDDDTTTTPIVDVPDDVDVSTTTTTASPSSASASVVVGDAPTDAPTIKDTTMTEATATTVTEKETGVVDTLTPTIIVKTTNNPTESPVTTITDAPITAAISKDTPVGGGDGETTTEETTNGSSSGGSNPWNENEINGSSSVSSSPTEAAALLSWSIALVVIIVVAML
jgi:exo-beta-1,3-glucanase (GH17 family)